MGTGLLGLPGLRLEEPGHRCDVGTHSRLADGRTLCWRPPDHSGRGHAVDGELASRVVAPALARRLPPGGRADPWGWWTRAEVCAKLLDVPVVVWVSTRDWPREGAQVVDGHEIHLSTHRGHGLVVSLGVLSPAGGLGPSRGRRGTPGPGA